MNTTQLEADLALRFSIFNNNNRFDWEHHLRYAREQTLYPPDLTERYVRALTQLRQLLEDSFLRQARYTLPLANMILDPGPWQIQLLCEYADLLLYLSVHDPGYPLLRQKLFSPVEARQQAMYFLHIGRLLRSAGLDVRFPAEINNQKNPDIKIIDPDAGQVINGEVSQLGKSQDHQDSERNYYQLHRVLDNHLTNPLYSAVQLQLMTKEYLANLGPLLTALQQQVEDTNTPGDYADLSFTIKLFPLSQQAALYDWMNAADRRKGLVGLPLSYDETRRISNYKIAQKAKQLLPDNPGILFFPVSPLHFWGQRVTETTVTLQSRMQKLPQVFGAYLFAEGLHFNAEQFRFNEDDGFDRPLIAGSLVRYSLFIANPAFDLPLLTETRRKLMAALTNQPA